MRCWMAFLLACALWAADPDPVPARRAAEAWLPLVDSGKYGESWDRAAESFKGAMTKAQWAQALKQSIGPLGKVKSRSLFLTQFLKDPPNSPPGDYYLLQFTSDREYKNGAIETVVMVYEDRKIWKLAGYFIK